MKYTLLLFFAVLLSAKPVYIVHIGGIDSNKYFYDPTSSRDEVARPYCALREAIEKEGFEVRFTHDASEIRGEIGGIISFNEAGAQITRNLRRFPREKCLLINTEPPVVMPNIYERTLTNYFGKIFVMFDSVVDNVNYFKGYYPQPRLQMIDDIPPFAEKKLYTIICQDKDSRHPDSLYGERRKVISYFSIICPDQFDLYGYSWPRQPAWKGFIPGKWEVLKKYKFCFCYENMRNQNGYITEKIFDCFVGGCVPIYWGASNVTDFIPKECFIDRRDFSSDAHLHHALVNMTEATYEKYLEAIRRFLASPQAQLFSVEHFVKTVVDELRRVN